MFKLLYNVEGGTLDFREILQFQTTFVALILLLIGEMCGVVFPFLENNHYLIQSRFDHVFLTRFFTKKYLLLIIKKILQDYKTRLTLIYNRILF